jgi:cysteinyl-tRNA synthetase
VFAMNVTDLDDKIVMRAQREGVSCAQLSQRFAQEFFEVSMLLIANTSMHACMRTGSVVVCCN